MEGSYDLLQLESWLDVGSFCANRVCRCLFMFRLKLHVVLHLSQRCHHLNRVCFAGLLLDLGVLPVLAWFFISLGSTYIDTHEHIMKLHMVRLVCRTRDRHTFSSPIVNLPCVSLFSFANASSFLIGSDCDTARQN